MSGKLFKYGYKLPHGKTIREEIWDELDHAMDRLMDDKPRSPREMHNYEMPLSSEKAQAVVDQWQDYGRDQGKAEALAYVIALFERPDHPDIESVKGAAVLRYKERQSSRATEELERDEQTLEAATNGGE
jgi:hypothetical protein